MDKKIRILHVVGSLGIGGIQNYLMNLYRNIDRNKVQFDFLVHIKSSFSYENEIIKLGGKVFYIENDYFEKRKFIKYIKFIKKFLNDHKEYKIVHGHLRTTSFIYLTIARKLKKTTICHSHSTTNGYGISGLFKNILQAPAKRVSTYFMGCSKIANIWMFGSKIANSDKCFVVNNGIEENKFIYNEKIRKKIRKKFNIESNVKIIGNVGRLIEQKNQIFLIEIIKELKDKNIKLIIVGDGHLKKELINLVKKYNLDDYVIFTGSRNDVSDIMQAFDIFVLPSKNEGLGIVAIESQASGLPTIISNNVPDEVIVTDLCKKCDSDSLNDWQNIIINELNSKKARKDMSLEIKKSGYSIKSISNWLCDFYINIK